MHVTFGRFELDTDRHALLAGGERIHVSPKAFQLLTMLVESSPRVMAKEELQDAIWPESYVDQSTLAGLVTELRSALGDDPKQPQFIRTVHGRGYAFCCPVEDVQPRKSAGFVVFRGEELPLAEGDNVLGRDAGADVQIDDPTVSRRHAKITIADGSAILEDLDSKNGTSLDGEPVHGSVPLADRQTVVLGDASLVFRTTAARGSTITIARRR